VPAHRTLVQEYHRLRAGGLFPGPHRVPHGACWGAAVRIADRI
jgi:hypothetical protein